MLDNQYAPYIRILLRYFAAAGFFGASTFGQALQTDPQFLQIVSAMLAGAVEGAYMWAKRKGMQT